MKIPNDIPLILCHIVLIMCTKKSVEIEIAVEIHKTIDVEKELIERHNSESIPGKAG